ncbi:MAG: hypothetical protein H6724_10715 [Sandaracinus sp.]|nr:hypothetical protein [Sandaracinus sp.]MCB9619905.1 hypothetical protein [Sandaracinus sp.]MCB9625169.1 hypothetical protein [Sandaracinus sp.]
MRKGWVVVCLAGAVGAAFAPVARAQDVSLEYAAAEGCPDRAWLRAEVGARLGRDPLTESAALTARVVTTRTDRGWRGELSLHEASRELGRRVLEDDDCRELTAALALSLAMALEAVVSERSPETAEETSAVDAHATDARRELVVRFELVPDRDAVDASGHAEGAPTRPRDITSLGLVARGGVALGQRPSLAPRAELALTLGRARFFGEVAGSFAPPTRATVRGRSLRTRDGELQLAGCVRPFEIWDLCAIAGLGRTVVQAQGDRAPRTWTGSAGVRTELAWRLARSLAITFGLDLRVNLRRPTVVSEDETLWRAPVLRGALLLGLRWRLAAWTETDGIPQASSGAAGARAWTTRSGT